MCQHNLYLHSNSHVQKKVFNVNKCANGLNIL